MSEFTDSRKLAHKQGRALARIKRYRGQLTFYRQLLDEEYAKLVDLGFSVDDIDWRDSMEPDEGPEDRLEERLDEINDMLGIK